MDTGKRRQFAGDDRYRKGFLHFMRHHVYRGRKLYDKSKTKCSSGASDGLEYAQRQYMAEKQPLCRDMYYRRRVIDDHHNRVYKRNDRHNFYADLFDIGNDCGSHILEKDVR